MRLLASGEELCFMQVAGDNNLFDSVNLPGDVSSCSGTAVCVCVCAGCGMLQGAGCAVSSERGKSAQKMYVL
jgi:hypothetical protein